MPDITASDNVAVVAAAIGTFLGSLWLAAKGKKLGDEAKHLTPPGAAPTTGVAITNEGAKMIAEPIEKIASVLDEWWTETKRYRESKTEETLEELAGLAEWLRGLTDPDFVEAIKKAYADRRHMDRRPDC